MGVDGDIFGSCGVDTLKVYWVMRCKYSASRYRISVSADIGRIDIAMSQAELRG